jgi:pilus assembly protein TadC
MGEKKRKENLMIGEFLSQYFPDLKKKLLLANITQTPSEFLQKAVTSTLFLSLALLILTFIFFNSFNINLLYLIPLFVVYFLGFFYLFLLYPDAMALKRQREIDYEIAFAGRHLLIALKSGMPLFPAITSLSTGYGYVSKEFSKIAENVSLGTPLAQALRDAASTNPSKYFVRILLQISNSLASGADIGNSLETVLDQISKEQIIQLREYGQKLTPLVMFFMLFGIIIPAIAIVGIVVLSAVITAGKLGVTSSILLYAFFIIVIIQYLFFGIIEKSRPKYLL